MSKRRYVSTRLRAQALGEQAPLERWQHGGCELVQSEYHGICAMRALEECALDRWLMVGAIDRDEHEAGLCLRRDYVQAGVALLASRTYDGVRGSTPGAAWQSPGERRSEEAERCYRRWREAIRALGARLSLVAIAVCCEDGALSWTRRDELRAALQQLQRFYRMN